MVSPILWNSGTSGSQSVLRRSRTGGSDAQQHPKHDELANVGVRSQGEPQLDGGSQYRQSFHHDRPKKNREGSAEISSSSVRDLHPGRASHYPYRHFGERGHRTSVIISAPHARSILAKNACHEHATDLMALPSAVALSRALSKMCANGACTGSFKVFLGDVNRCYVDLNRNPTEATYQASMHSNILSEIKKDPKVVMDMHSYPPEMDKPYDNWKLYDLSIMVYPEYKDLALRLKGFLLLQDASRKIQIVDAHPVSYIQATARNHGIPCLLLEHNEGSFYKDSDLKVLDEEKVIKMAWDTSLFVQTLCAEWNVEKDTTEDLRSSLLTHREYLDTKPFVI